MRVLAFAFFLSFCFLGCTTKPALQNQERSVASYGFSEFWIFKKRLESQHFLVKSHPIDQGGVRYNVIGGDSRQTRYFVVLESGGLRIKGINIGDFAAILNSAGVECHYTASNWKRYLCTDKDPDHPYWSGREIRYGLQEDAAVDRGPRALGYDTEADDIVVIPATGLH